MKDRGRDDRGKEGGRRNRRKQKARKKEREVILFFFFFEVGENRYYERVGVTQARKRDASFPRPMGQK